jgi:hypothetical protein
MTISSAQLTALRALLTGDELTFNRLLADSGLARTHEFAVLTAAALAVAARRRFPPGWSQGDVVRLVARLRTRDAGAHADINAAAAEQMLASVLGTQHVRDDFDVLASGYAQIALLSELVVDLNENQLEDLLAEAHTQADRWLVRQTRQP